MNFAGGAYVARFVVGMYAPFASWKVSTPICVPRMGAYIAPESVATYAPPA
ncbi:MAG: hypothetical protein ABSF46_09415 [Terriglobia bacterium]|jgi:hypothetical protein